MSWACSSQRAEDMVVFQLFGVILEWTYVEFSSLELRLTLGEVKIETLHVSSRISTKIYQQLL